MGGWLILIAVFLLVQALMHRKARQETVINWQEAAACETEQEALRQERLAMLPTRQERIERCKESIEKIRADWAACRAQMLGEFEPEELICEPVAVFYTHIPLDRAIIYQDKATYMVCFEHLELIRENALAEIYTPGMPCGSWKESYPSRFFDTREEAERIAQKAMQWLN